MVPAVAVGVPSRDRADRLTDETTSLLSRCSGKLHETAVHHPLIFSCDNLSRFGEYSGKDFEAGISRALLVKPLASMFTAYPPIYQPNVTCVEVQDYLCSCCGLWNVVLSCMLHDAPAC